MNNNIFIKPIGILPLPFPKFMMEHWLFVTSILGVVLLGLFIGIAVEKYSKAKWQKSYLLNIILPMSLAPLLFILNGINMNFIKGLIFLALLLVASNSDINNRTVSNWIPFSVAILGFVGISLEELPIRLLAVVIITLPQLVIAITKENSYGGADIKLMAACTFLLGLEGGLAAMIIGLTTGIITTLMSNKIKNKKQNGKFPVIPYLSMGSFLLFMII